MKVKNIMFSGVMGVILMSVASSANAAISVASKAYVDTKASSVEAAYKAADTALETAYKAADTALGARVTQNETDITKNAQAIEAVKDLTGTEGVAKQIEDALKVESDARAAAVSALQTKDTELAGDIAEVDAKFGDYTKTSDLNTTYVSETEMSAFKTANDTAVADAKKAGTDAAAALEAYETANDAAVSALQTKDTELAGDIDAVDAKFADYTKTSDLDATFATNEELAGAVSDLEAADEALDGKISAMDTAYKAADTTLDGKITAMDTAYKAADTTLDGKITAMDAAYKAADTGLAEDIADVDAKFGDYTKTADLDATFATNEELAAAKSGAEATAAVALEAYKTTNDAAVAAKVAKSDYDAKVTAIENALDTKIAMPAACETQDCVLAINKASGTISWTPLTEPVADFINQQN